MNLGRAYDFPKQDTPAFPGKNVTVFGAGNVAMDAARTALRMARKRLHRLPPHQGGNAARREEIEHARKRACSSPCWPLPCASTATPKCACNP